MSSNISDDGISDEISTVLEERNSLVWDNKIPLESILKWLDNFLNTEEKSLALEILAQFTFFEKEDVDSLLKSAYNLFCHEIAFELDKKKIPMPSIRDYINNNTYFLGMSDNPSKSGTHLLYPFRQVNCLKIEHFPDSLERIPENIRNIVFLDDIIGSGDESISQWKNDIKETAERHPDLTFYYISLFGLQRGIQRLKNETSYKVIVVYEMDDTQRVFSDKSGFFSDDSRKGDAKNMCVKYGNVLYLDGPLGYKDSQLLLGFEHNVPDNTLPIIWSNKNWFPIMIRKGET